jgi:hypothetical protein
MFVFYGTSSAWNTGEALLVHLASQYSGLPGMFFTYPVSSNSWRWVKDYVEIFYPETPPDLGNFNFVLGDRWIRIITIFDIIEEAGVANLMFGKIVEEVKMSRQKNVLVAWRKKREKIIPVRSQKHELGDLEYMNLAEVARSPDLKLGGSVIYYIIGRFMKERKEAVLVLPRRPKPGVLQNLHDGWGMWDENRIITSGMLDIVTESQMEFYTKGEYKTAPPSLVGGVVTNMAAELISRVLVRKEDCLLVVKNSGNVEIKEWMKDVWG